VNLIELAVATVVYGYVLAAVAAGPVTVALAVRDVRQHPYLPALRDEEQLELEVAA
jgi:hypothetical protein